jgi:type IV pilus assembly protein PilZ
MSKKSGNKGGSKPNINQERAPASASGSSVGSISDRTDHRVPIQLLVDYRADGHYLFDFCRDLGTGGVFIETKQPLSTGSEIELTFTIPDSKETLRTKGKVIWSQSAVAGREDINVGMGVQFTKFSESQRKTLDEFINRYGGKNLGSAAQRRAG